MLKDLLKALGADAATIAKVTADKAEYDAQEVAETILGNMKEALQNDEDFIKPLKSAWQGEVLSSKEREIIRLSGGKLTQAEVAAMPKTDRFNKVLELFAERMAVEPTDDGKQKKSQDDKDKEIAKLRTDLATIEAKAKDLEDVQLPAARGEADKVATTFKLQREIEKALTGKADRKLVLDVDRTRRLVESDLQEQYDLVWDGTKNTVVVKQKGQDLLAYDKKDKSKALTLADVIEQTGETAGYFVKNNGKPETKGGTRTIEEGDKAPKYKLPGMKKAKAAEAAASGDE